MAKPARTDPDDRVVLPLDPNEALRALLKVDPNEPVEDDDQPSE